MSIVLSSSLVLSAAEEALPDSTPIIGYHNILGADGNGAVNANSASAGHTYFNLQNPSTALYWQSTVTSGAEALTVLTSYTDEIDYVGIAKHNFGSGTVAVQLEGSPDASTWTELVAEFMPADDSPIIMQFTPAVWNFLRVNLTANGIAPQAAVMYVGKLLILERSIKLDQGHVPITMGRRAKIASGLSESGNFLGRVVTTRYRETKAQFAWFTPVWYRANMDPFIVASKTTPFFWAWNPGEYPTETGYCWMMNEPMAEVDPVTRRIALDMEMRGVA